MKKKRLLSILLTLTMIFSCIASLLPVNAAVDFNGAGGSVQGGSGSGGYDANWGMAGFTNRFGYRVSLWFAPQVMDGSTYVYDENGEPEWDWPNLQQVGKTIDIKRQPLTYNSKSIKIPHQWGSLNAKLYADKGGAYNNKFGKYAFDYTQNQYYYYGFSNNDHWEIWSNNNDDRYVCAILNSDVIAKSGKIIIGKNGEEENVTQDKLNADYNKVLKEISNLRDATSDEKIREVCNQQEDLLNLSYRTIDNLDLPLIHNQGENSKSNQTYEDDLRYYLINPTVLELMFTAMGANVSAVDFYLGCWDGPDGNVNTDPRAKKNPHGIFKIVVENMFMHRVNGNITAMTVQDVISMGEYPPGKGVGGNLWSMYGQGSYLSVMNRMKLSNDDKTDKDFFKVTGTGTYMGALASGGFKEVTSKNMADAHKYYAPDQFVGNYLGLSTITSASILARADRMQDERFQSYIGFYAIGNQELSSGIENSVLTDIVNNIIKGDKGEAYLSTFMDALDSLASQNDEVGNAIKYMYSKGGRDSIKKSLERVIEKYYNGEQVSLTLTDAVNCELWNELNLGNAYINEYFDQDYKRAIKLKDEYKHLSGKSSEYNSLEDAVEMANKHFKLESTQDQLKGAPDNVRREVEMEVYKRALSNASAFVGGYIISESNKIISNMTKDVLLKIIGDNNAIFEDVPEASNRDIRISDSIMFSMYDKTEQGSMESVYDLNTSGKLASYVKEAASGQKVIIKMPRLKLSIRNKKLIDLDVLRKWSNVVNERIGHTIETNIPELFDKETNKFILGENKEYYTLNTNKYIDSIVNDSVEGERTTVFKRYSVPQEIVTTNSTTNDCVSDVVIMIRGFCRAQHTPMDERVIPELRKDLTLEAQRPGKDAMPRIGMILSRHGLGNIANQPLYLAAITQRITMNNKHRYLSSDASVGAESKSLREQGFTYGTKIGPGIGVVESNLSVSKASELDIENEVKAYPISTEEEMLNHICELMTVDPLYSKMSIEETDGEVIYSGNATVNHIILDNGCRVNVKFVDKDADGKLAVIGSRQLDQAVSRFNSINVTECLNSKGATVALGGKVYKISVMSRLPHGVSESELINTLESNMSATTPGVDTEYTFGKIRAVTGNEYITNALVYPTAEELKDSEEINVYCVVEEVEAPKLVVVYEDESENHERTCIDNPTVTDNKVTVPDIAGYEILAGYISIQEPAGGNTEATTWEQIRTSCEPYDGQWISGKGPHIVEITPTESQFIYVRARKPLVTPIAPAPGDYTISQQTISKQFKTSGVLTNKLKDALVYFDSTHHIWYCSSMMCSGHKCSIGTTSSGNYNLKYVVENETDKKVVAYNAGTSNTDNTTGSRKWDRRDDSITTRYPNYNFVAWRGYDKPVAASYANDNSKLTEVYSAFGIGSGKERGSSELNSSYNKPIKFTWGLGSGSSTSVNFLCSEGYYHGGTVGIHNSSIKSADANVAVNVFEGSKSAQTATNSSPALTTIGGVAMTSVGTATVAGAGISFYPYVDMKYQKLDGGTQSLNVLSKYKSVINPINTVDYGFKAGANGSLAVTSSMWSTHQRAVQAKGAGNSLVGGAMYKLGNGNASMLPQMGITTYQWYVPSDATGAVVSGSAMTQAKAEQAHQDAVNSLKAAVTGKQIVQKLQPNCTGGTFNVSPGMQASWLSGDASVRLTTNTTQETKKYWFNNVPLKTKIMDTSATIKDYYRINSDTNGNVYLVHGSTVDHTFDKNATTDYILSNMSAEWKEINNKTGLVSTYLKSVIRNKGNDASYGVSGGTWYNEAFPGLCVVKQQTTFSIGMDTAGKSALDNVVDLRLVAGGTQSKADIFKKFNKSFFNVDSFNTAFTFKGSSVPVSGVSLNLRSKDFFIPNATVYDND